jgi:hypothetical protein
MKVKFLLALAAAFLFASATTIFVSAYTITPVSGIQVVIETDPPGYRGARPTDDQGTAPFAGLDGGTYTVTLKRFSKATGSYNVTITGSGGVKKTEVWDAEKKDSFKTSVVLRGAEAAQSISIAITTVDGASPK